METALSLQHVGRVTEALNTTTGGWAGYTQLALYWLANASDLSPVQEGHLIIEPVSALLLVGIDINSLADKRHTYALFSGGAPTQKCAYRETGYVAHGARLYTG